MKLAILETGLPPEGLDAEHGSYPDMFRAMLAPLMPGLETVDYRVCDGAGLPRPDDFDGFLVTGSPAGVYEDHDWIAPLEDFIRAVHAAKRPMVGICFGHQVIASALGGRVEKSTKGWGAGVHTYEVVGEAVFMAADRPARLACAVSHQDQVVEPPAGARRIAGSPFCPYGILEYRDGPALSIQAHPEFTHDFARALMDLRSDRIPQEVRALAGPSLSNGSDRGLLARWIARFYSAAGDAS